MDLVPEKIVNSSIQRVIGVISGKGGVGKSTVAVLLAQALAAKGKRVGVLDADITGPSLPRLFGIDSFRAETDGTHIFPIQSEEGVKVLSINLLYEAEDQPVIWRGPLLGKAIEQFWSDTDWGELDYLIVDFPPGTSDVALTAFQRIPFAGVLVVGTPQDYVSMIVRKSIKMAASLKAPVLGIVENMRSLVCPHCGEVISLFDDGNGGAGKEGDSARYSVPVIASIPWRKEIAQARSIRWKNVPDAARKDFEAVVEAVETKAGGSPLAATPIRKEIQ